MENDEIRRLHDFEQNSAQVCSRVPYQLKGFYDALLREGFSNEDAIYLTGGYLTRIVNPVAQE